MFIAIAKNNYNLQCKHRSTTLFIQGSSSVPVVILGVFLKYSIVGQHIARFRELNYGARWMRLQEILMIFPLPVRFISKIEEVLNDWKLIGISSGKPLEKVSCCFRCSIRIINISSSPHGDVYTCSHLRKCCR